MLKGKTKISGAIRDAIQNSEKIPRKKIEQVESLINCFFNLSDESAIKCLTETSQALVEASDKKVLGEFVETWLPVIFDNPEILEEIRKKIDSGVSTPVDIPCFLAIPVELLMARLADVNPSFTLLPNQKIGASFDIGAIHEVGVDSSGKQTEKVINEAIKSRFSSIYDLEKTVGDALDFTFQKHNLTELRLDQIEEDDRIKVLKHKFEQLADKHGRNYYFCCDLEKKSEDNNTITEGFIRVKKNYPTLILISKDNSKSTEEFLKYDPLYQIIDAGKQSNV